MTTTRPASLDARQPLPSLWHYAHRHHVDIIVATIYSILNRVFDLAPPVLIGAAVDVVVQKENSIMAQLGVVNVTDQLLVLVVITAVVWGLESLFQYAYALKWRNLAQTIQHDLRLDAYAHAQSLELAYYEDRSTGNLMAILNDDINQLERFLDIGANDIVQLVTTVVVIGATYLIIVPGVAWMALLPVPFIIWGSLRFQRLLAPRYAVVRERVGLLNSQLANNLSGITTIKSYTAENHELKRIATHSHSYAESNRQAIAFSSAFVPLIRMVIAIGFIAILYFGGLMVLAGTLNVGAYSVLVFMTQRLLWPLTRLGETLDLYQRAMASTARVLNLMGVKPQIVDGMDPMPLAGVQGELAFEDVTFEYGQNNDTDTKPQQHVLRNLSFHVSAGETVALVGATGAGKSTVVKLMMRLYDVQSGRVLIDGNDVRQLPLRHVRQAIGFVSQDVFLFHGTVRENIMYGSFDADDESITQAAQVAEAHQFILELPQGYDTIVGERGQKLSGGQRQRISIARAILKDPPILILDEATSSVDNETEAAIQRSLERIAIGRTTIVIAHRLSTVRNADRIFVLENGCLREEGVHDQLVLKDGIYAGLWRVQTGTALGSPPLR